MTLDAAGNVYTTGAFSGTIDADPGPGTFNLKAGGTGDVYVSKLDSSGSFVWAADMLRGALGSQGIGFAITVDGSGNVFTSGFLKGTADFDPGAGTSSLPNGGQNDGFVCRLDSGGNFVWATRMGKGGYDSVTEITLDRQLKTAVALAEPIMLFGIAGLIGTIFIGMVIPIFTIQDYIK